MMLFPAGYSTVWAWWKSFLFQHHRKPVTESRCLRQSLTTIIFSVFEKVLPCTGSSVFDLISWPLSSRDLSFSEHLALDYRRIQSCQAFHMGNRDCVCAASSSPLEPSSCLPFTSHAPQYQGNEQTLWNLPHSPLSLPYLTFSISISHYLLPVISGSACADSISQKSVIIWDNMLHPLHL